ncbi:MAG TPA: sugar phosphate isomerase/epimerase family protein [Roseiflexaceae bacterium]|nr:sugar phosphate isomerase/epimerase family protein [Roseiflexaceae bacterium]HMP42989.1 sugar phosphate isomerase/epimerase family protein [Roseiflexaceae bacterium]
MTHAIFTLSAFGDEIDAELETQLTVLASEGVLFLELRNAWGKNVLDLDAAELRRARALLDTYGFGVSAIGSPIGKSALDQPPSFELERLDRAAAAADVLGTRKIRIFSFFIAAGEADTRRSEVLARMGALTTRAGQLGLTLVHENEKEIYGDTAERCHDLLATIDSPALRMAFDPANFVQCGVRPMEVAWPLLADYVTHVHIKDAVFADGGVRPAGQGDGAIPALLAALDARGYEGFLTLEPHLQVAGPSGGFSGEAGMRLAIQALRELLYS